VLQDLQEHQDLLATRARQDKAVQREILEPLVLAGHQVLAGPRGQRAPQVRRVLRASWVRTGPAVLRERLARVDRPGRLDQLVLQDRLVRQD